MGQCLHDCKFLLPCFLAFALFFSLFHVLLPAATTEGCFPVLSSTLTCAAPEFCVLVGDQTRLFASRQTGHPRIIVQGFCSLANADPVRTVH